MPEPFRIAITDAVLEDLRFRLERTRFAPDDRNDDWSFGVNGDYLKALVRHWLEVYDWRKHEAAMNAWPQFHANVHGVPVHFLHIRGRGPDPLPLIVSHGWPWTFWDFQKVIGPLTDPVAHGGQAEDSFDLVVPSLPGFGFSRGFLPSGNPPTVVANLWLELMCDVLGYKGFGAHGGDWGTYITQHLGHAYPAHVVGIHVSLAAFLGLSGDRPRPEDYAGDEAGWFERLQQSLLTNVSHRWVNANEPQTAAYAMHDSPAGLLATLVDKRHRWGGGAHVEDTFAKDELITTAMLYWVTETFASSARYYAERQRHPWAPVNGNVPLVPVPTAVAVFPEDVIIQPRRIAEELTNLTRWTVMPSGGHFAPMEQPDLLVSDIREHFRLLRP